MDNLEDAWLGAFGEDLLRYMVYDTRWRSVALDMAAGGGSGYRIGYSPLDQ